MYYWIFGFFALVSWLVSKSLENKIKKYSEVSIPLSGAEVAKKMLKENGIDDVDIVSVNGQLTDHYNPLTKTVNLSEVVYGKSNIAAAAVAAHECGHALQHAFGYAPLKMRSKLVPVVSFASKYVMWVILVGVILINQFNSPYVLMAGIALFALTTLFSFITLPVEINASKRAIAWLEQSGLVTRENEKMVKSALKTAAYTYVVAALSSLATLFYYVMVLVRNNR